MLKSGLFLRWDLTCRFLTEIKTKNDNFKSHFFVIFTSWNFFDFFEIFRNLRNKNFNLKFFQKNSMVPRWCSRDDSFSNPDQQQFSGRMKFMKSQVGVSGPWIYILPLFSFFRFLSFDLKFLKPIGYTVCIPTNGRRLTEITWEEFSINEKPENRIKKINEDAAPDETFFPNFF